MQQPGFANLLKPARSRRAKSTSAPSSTCEQMTFGDFGSAISLPGSVVGPWRCDSLACPTPPPCGQDRRPANHSASPANNSALMTIATSGQSSSASSESAGPDSSLGSKSPARLSSEALQSRLNAVLSSRLGLCGSMEYSLTSNLHSTPAGRQIFRLRASARRTSANEPGGWPTVTSEDAKSSDGPKAGQDLALSGWPTCSARDWKDTPGMATTGTNPDGSERSRLDQLPRVAALAATGPAITGWPTPDTNQRGGPQDAEKRKAGGHSVTLQDAAHGAPLTSSPAGTEKPGGCRFVLNPCFSMHLMGYPISWLIAGMRSLLNSGRK